MQLQTLSKAYNNMVGCFKEKENSMKKKRTGLLFQVVKKKVSQLLARKRAHANVLSLSIKQKQHQSAQVLNNLNEYNMICNVIFRAIKKRNKPFTHIVHQTCLLH